MPNTEAPADIENTPEDRAFVEAENARLAARASGMDFTDSDDGSDAGPVDGIPGTEPDEPAKVEEVEAAPANEDATPTEGEDAKPEADPTLAILQELRAERQAREAREAEWLAQQEQARRANEPKTLAERDISWHKQYAAQLGYDFSDPKTALIQAKQYEQYIQQLDAQNEIKQLRDDLQQLGRQAQQLVRNEQVANVLSAELDKFELSDAAKVRTTSVANKLINAGYAPRDALNEALALVSSVAKRKAAPTTQQPAQPAKPTTPQATRQQSNANAIRAGAIQGRGASRNQPKSAGQKLEATRNRLFR